MKKVLSLALMLFVIVMNALAQTEKFCIASKGRTATIVVDDNDWKGVLRAANNLGDDVRKVSGTAAPIVESAAVPQQPQQPASIIAGTIGKSRLVDRLVKQKKIDVKKVRGQWESYLIDVVDVLTPYHRITVTSAICEMRKTKGIILYI